jgi:mannose-6-phosphate isomerase-like protein (cupin superfamily)
VAVGEAPLRETKHGLCPDGEGWFVLNARDSRWRDYGPMGFGCNFEGKRRFPQLGINLNVLARGASLGLYHRENHQEDFLVLAGECVLVVEGGTRPLKAWDFVHCPGGTAHMIVGAGDEPAVVLAVGARGGRTGLRYLVDPAARKLGVSVETETTKPAEAYASFPRSARTTYRDAWLPDF